MPVYRYRLAEVDLGYISKRIPQSDVSSLVSGDSAAALYWDVTVNSTAKADLDSAMEALGWEYIEQDPTDSPTDAILTSSSGPGYQPQSHRSASVDPTVNDDSGDGYAVGSYWVNTSTDNIFICLDATEGAAVWNSLLTTYADEATSTVATTTTSLTDVLMAPMTITPPAGEYLVIASCDLEHDTNGATIWISIYVGGVQVAHSERLIKNPRWNNASWEGFTQAIVTANGSQAIELRWRVSGGTGTANNRAITVMGIS